jgi:hypothetical protein
MMSLEQLQPYWDRVIKAPNQIETERAFQHMLIIQHPELIINTKQKALKNVQIILHYFSQFERQQRQTIAPQLRETIEICINFMRIWILDLTVTAIGI